jgi:hypothetical protein
LAAQVDFTNVIRVVERLQGQKWSQVTGDEQHSARDEVGWVSHAWGLFQKG